MHRCRRRISGRGGARAIGTIGALALLALLTGAAVRAETVYVDGHLELVGSDIARPHRGMSMSSVEARFGAPARRYPAVGQPPITRWDYPQFSVFFEYKYVIHAVVHAPLRAS